MKIKSVLTATRANFLPASIVPFLIGAAYAFSHGFAVLPSRFILALLAVVSAHTAGNLFNDYYDFRSGADNVVRKESPFFGGSRVIQDGLLKPAEVFWLALLFGIFSALCVGGLVAITGRPIFFLMMSVVAVLSIGYTLPPLCLAYRKLGELDIFLLFGVFLVTGSFYLFSLVFETGAVWISLPIAFLVVNIIISNEIPDFVSDQKTGKLNLLSLTGQRRGYLLYGALLVLSAGSVVANIVFNNLSAWAFCLIPAYMIGLKVLRLLKDHFEEMPASRVASGLTIVLHLIIGLGMVGVILLGG